MAVPASTVNGKVRFGLFEADLDRQELRKSGIRVRLQKQPFQVLSALLEHAGEVVTREDLQQRIWPRESPSDVDHHLNKAVNKIRAALGDSADNPRFVETHARRGYRFIAPVDSGAAPAPPSAKERTRTRMLVPLLATAAVVAVLVFAFARGPREPSVTGYRQLTNDARQKLDGVLSDGREVFFVEFSGGRTRLCRLPVKGGEATEIPTPFDEFTSVMLLDLAPGGRDLLIKTSGGLDYYGVEGPLWLLPLDGREPQRLGDLEASAATWSPNGKHLAYFHGSDLLVARGDGSSPRRITSKPGRNGAIQWSPDGERIRFSTGHPAFEQNTIWEVSVAGGDLHPVYPDWNYEQYSGEWTRNADYFLFFSPSDFNLWIAHETTELIGASADGPTQLTSGPVRFRSPRLSPEGKTLLAIGEMLRGELLRWNSDAKQFLPHLPGLSADQLDYSQDGEWLTYVSFPDDDLWVSRAGGTERRRLTEPPMRIYLPRFSPDGSQIAFMGRMSGERWRIRLIPAAGGDLEVLIPGEGTEADPNWSPDGKKLVFAPLPWETDPEETGIRIIDLDTRAITHLPNSTGLFSPRWSPDGRYIAALRHGNSGLDLFDRETWTWSTLFDMEAGFPAWSRDGNHVYFYHAFSGNRGVYRINIHSRELEQVTTLRGIEIAGTLGPYGLSLGPDDSPIILRDRSIQEVYALQLSLP